MLVNFPGPRLINILSILRHPDFEREFFIQTDASDHAVGAVLLQDFGNGYLEPIEFASRQFTESELHWHGIQ